MKKEICGSIIELTVDDLGGCALFWDIPSKLADPIQSGEKNAFAYKIGDSLVGGCVLSIKDDCGHFSYFAVSPDFRRKGIGSNLLKFAEKYFREMGFSKMRLHVDKSNYAAIKLYERKGFAYERDATIERIVMIKAL